MFVVRYNSTTARLAGEVRFGGRPTLTAAASAAAAASLSLCSGDVIEVADNGTRPGRLKAKTASRHGGPVTYSDQRPERTREDG